MKMHTSFSIRSIVSLLVVILAGCREDANPPPAPDNTAPTVVFVNPANLATDVPINRKIVATFSESMDPQAVTGTTFTLRHGTTAVTGAVSCIGIQATFTPAASLSVSTLYTATISTGARDLAGNALKSAYIWTFITGSAADSTPPTVSSVYPLNLATNVPVNMAVSATFSESMDPLTIAQATFTVTQGTTPVSGSLACAGTTATFTPAGNLASNTLFTATITTGVKDLSGNALAAGYAWTFTTGATAAVLNPVVLGQASDFAILAGYAITNVPSSVITGDVGISPAAESFITGFTLTDWTGYATSTQVVNGFVYAADMASPTPSMLTDAKGDLTIAYNDAAGRTPVPTGNFLNPGAGNLAGLNLAPGLYKFTGEALATTGFTLTGDANDVWIFQIASNLNISNGVQVTLAGGAQAKNIFWQVGTEATLGTTVTFHGTIMADAAITINTGAILYGRALAFTGTVALDQCTITITIP